MDLKLLSLSIKIFEFEFPLSLSLCTLLFLQQLLRVNIFSALIFEKFNVIV